MPWPPTADEVLRELRITSITSDQRAVLEDALAAAVDLVAYQRRDLWAAWAAAGNIDDFDPPDRIHRGTVRYAGRLYTRAVNTTGVDPATALGLPPTYALDWDVAQLLGLSRFRRPSAG